MPVQTIANQDAPPDTAFEDALSAALRENHGRARPLKAASVDEMNVDRSLAFYKERFADSFRCRRCRPGVTAVTSRLGLKPSLAPKHAGGRVRRSPPREAGTSAPYGHRRRKLVDELPEARNLEGRNPPAAERDEILIGHCYALSMGTSVLHLNPCDETVTQQSSSRATIPTGRVCGRSRTPFICFSRLIVLHVIASAGRRIAQSQSGHYCDQQTGIKVSSQAFSRVFSRGGFPR